MKHFYFIVMMVLAHNTVLLANLDVQFTPSNPVVCKGKSITINAQLTGAGTGTFTFPYTKSTGSEIYLSPSGNDVTGNGTMGNPYKTIQKGVNVSNNGMIITLLDGTYSGSGNVNVSLSGKQIIIQSQNGPLSTSIDCNQNGRAFIINQGETMNTIIKGLTIMNGKTNSAPNGYGSAIFVEDNSGITVKECFFRGNTQGTIQLGDTEVSGPQSKIEHCAFIGNAEGCIHSSKKSFMVEACLFVNNTSSGGLVGNGHVADPAQQYKNCVFVCNTGQTVAGINHGKFISNSLFISNTTTVGVVYAGTNWSGMNTIDHCTFYNNTCSYYNSTWYDHKGEAKSSIFYPGNARNHVSGNHSIIPFFYCLGDGISGNGNIQGDPKFVNQGAFDFSLQSSSPCKGKGEGGTDMGANVSLIPNWLIQYIKANASMTMIDWEGGAKTASATFTPMATKYYKVTFSGCGISFTDSVLITIKDDVTYTKVDTSCNPYIWNGKTYTISGKYTETFVSVDGCDSNVTLDLVIHQKPNPNITGLKTICLGMKNVPYSVQNTPSSTFLWKQPQKGVITSSLLQSTATVDWNSLGIDTLHFTQTNTLTGCKKDTFIVVNISPTPIPIITGNAQSCVGTKNVEYSATPNATGISYSWTLSNKGILKTGANVPTIKIDWNTEGVDTLRLTMTNIATGCSKDTIFIVRINPQPKPIITGMTTICLGMPQTTYSVPNVAGSTFQWKKPKNGIIKGSSQQHEVIVNWTNAGIDTIQCTQTNIASGCTKDTLLIVNIVFSPAPLIKGEKVACINAKSIEYIAQPQMSGLTYQWSNPKKGVITKGQNSPFVFIDWNQDGLDTVLLKVTDITTGCSKDTMFIVQIIPLSTPNILGSTVVCEQSKDVPYEVKFKPGFTYQWSQPTLGNLHGDPRSTAITIDWEHQGIDTVRITETHGLTKCSRDSFLIVSIQKTISPTVYPFAEEYFLCEGDSRGLECNVDADEYIWKFNGEVIPYSKSKIHLAMKEGTYSVFVKQGLCSGESKGIFIAEKDKPQPSISGPTIIEDLQNNVPYSVTSTLTGSTFEWQIEGNAIINGSKNGTSVNVHFLDTGAVKLIVIEKTLFDCIDKDTLNIKVNKNTMTSVHEKGTEIIISPHPLKSGQTFSVTNAYAHVENIHVQLFDLLGRCQFERIIHTNQPNFDVLIPNLLSGFYQLRLMHNGLSHEVIVFVEE